MPLDFKEDSNKIGSQKGRNNKNDTKLSDNCKKKPFRN